MSILFLGSKRRNSELAQSSPFDRSLTCSLYRSLIKASSNIGVRSLAMIETLVGRNPCISTIALRILDRESQIIHSSNNGSQSCEGSTPFDQKKVLKDGFSSSTAEKVLRDAFRAEFVSSLNSNLTDTSMKVRKSIWLAKQFHDMKFFDNVETTFPPTPATLFTKKAAESDASDCGTKAQSQSPVTAGSRNPSQSSSIGIINSYKNFRDVAKSSTSANIEHCGASSTPHGGLRRFPAFERSVSMDTMPFVDAFCNGKDFIHEKNVDLGSGQVITKSDSSQGLTFETSLEQRCEDLKILKMESSASTNTWVNILFQGKCIHSDSDAVQFRYRFCLKFEFHGLKGASNTTVGRE